MLLGHLEFLPRVVSSPYPETRKELNEVVEFLYHSPSKAIFQSHLSVSSEKGRKWKEIVISWLTIHSEYLVSQSFDQVFFLPPRTLPYASEHFNQVSKANLDKNPYVNSWHLGINNLNGGKSDLSNRGPLFCLQFVNGLGVHFNKNFTMRVYRIRQHCDRLAVIIWGRFSDNIYKRAIRVRRQERIKW